MGSITAHGESLPNIIDIRSDTAGIELKHLIVEGLKSKDGREKTLPTLLLYDDAGLKLFERITYLEEYYLTGEEIEVLQGHAKQIAERIPNHAMVVELGSGNLRKVKVLLDALEAAKKDVSYYALDLMQSELERTLAAVPEGSYKHVRCFGLLGTYDDGLAWLKRKDNANRPKTILSMGSSIGNFPRDEAAEFLKQFADILGPQDSLLIGVDACQDPAKVYQAYNDGQGITHEFTLNGLKHANELLGHEAFKQGEWKTFGRYDEVDGRHQAFVAPTRDVVVEGVSLRADEWIRIEESYKYSSPQAEKLWSAAGVIEAASWENAQGSYGMAPKLKHLIKRIRDPLTTDYELALHMLNKPVVMYPTKPEQYAAHPIPSIADWESLWKAWDIVTRQMIPETELGNKPIKLRNACIFYLGHIPAFLDLKIVEGTSLKPTEPAYFHKMFERGIDPDVDNPEQCHAHSEIPDEWPALQEMLEYQDRVRQRVIDFYKTGQAYDNAWTGRVLWLGFEHEIMHLETLLYMLLQSDKTLPPAGTIKPDFEQLAKHAEKNAVDNEWFDVPGKSVTIGIDDPDTADGPVRHFGWDVEKPQRKVEVKGLKAKARPINNGEYARYLCDTGKQDMPASWQSIAADQNGGVTGLTNGKAKLQDFLSGKAARTVYGPVPLRFALDWPVSASYDELAGCAAYMGGRIPTMEEARNIYKHADGLNKKEATQTLGKTIPAVNGHLVNEGVEESPPSRSSLTGPPSIAAGLNPHELFVNLDEANVGFKHWHPMPVTQSGGRLSGQGEMGGLWEWTSSVLEKQDGFEPMKLYPAYSDDFYDEKHNIVLGGSWATHPRVAGRKTFVNWYQRSYPYVWAGARLVKDL